MGAPDVVPPAAARAVEPGSPSPLGATPEPRGTNFAVHSPAATRVTLALFAPGGVPRGEVRLDPARNRTGDVWHVFVPGARAGAEYGWRADSDARGPGHAFDPGALLLDPYGKGVAGSERWGERQVGGRLLRSVVCDLAHDWGDDRRPATPLADTVLYEAHVRTFTRHASSRVRAPGTFAGLIERIPWLRSLGVTAVQLMPVAEFDETDNARVRPDTGKRLLNVWGYSPLAFMAPKTSYASEPTAAGALREFRALVRALHAAGLELILDVVFNHTGEGGLLAPARSWRGLDRPGYFLLDELGRDLDFTGTGHTFACASPVASRMILDALRFWATEMRVDGFRFDLASTLTRDERGGPLEDPPLIRRIAAEPALAPCKLIAEPWDIGLYHVGRFPQPGRFVELNGRFRDDVRDWLRGASVKPGVLAHRLAGSDDLYAPASDGAARPARHGDAGPRAVNFITSHDGFTLADLVSFERKHNEANGEENRDGGDDNRAWNGGAEGPTRDPAVLAARARQARNAAGLLLLSRGPLLWLWGDEGLRSQSGNNNPWCQDGPDWWLDWDAAKRRRDFTRFVRGLLALRRDHALLRSGPRPGPLGGVPPGRRLAMPLPGEGPVEFLLLANGEAEPAEFALPPPRAGRAWRRVVDTAARPPADFTPLAEAPPLAKADPFRLEARALVLLAGRA